VSLAVFRRGVLRLAVLVALLVTIGGVTSAIADDDSSNSEIEVVSGILTEVTGVGSLHASACVQSATDGDVNCAGLLLAPDARVPAIGTRVLAGIAAIPGAAFGDSQPSRRMFYVYIIPE